MIHIIIRLQGINLSFQFLCSNIWASFISIFFLFFPLPLFSHFRHAATLLVLSAWLANYKMQYSCRRLTSLKLSASSAFCPLPYLCSIKTSQLFFISLKLQIHLTDFASLLETVKDYRRPENPSYIYSGIADYH